MSYPLSVTIDSAHLSYRRRLVFDELNFTLVAGRWTCILGSSGVGKSSLLKLLAGLIQSDEDVQASANIQCSDGLALQGRIAYMAQTDRLLPWLSILDNVLLGPRLRQQVNPQLKARAIALLAQVGLADVMHAFPASLSGGMRQRAAMARTLLEDKPIVLMDEPFSALDAITRLKLQDLAAELLGGKTCVLITHDPLEALRLGHDIYILAGQPATLQPVTALDTPTPRPLQDASLLEWQARLLTQLAEDPLL